MKYFGYLFGVIALVSSAFGQEVQECPHNPKKVSILCEYSNPVVEVGECGRADIGSGYTFRCYGSCRGTHTIDWSKPHCKAPCVLASKDPDNDRVFCGRPVSCQGVSTLSYRTIAECNQNKHVRNCAFQNGCDPCGKKQQEVQRCVSPMKTEGSSGGGEAY